MKKFFMSIAVMAALCMVSCSSSEAAKEGEKQATEVVDQINNSTSEEQVQGIIENVQTKVEELVNSGKIDEAKAYLDKIAPVVKEKFPALSASLDKASALIDTAKSASDAVAGAVDNAKDAASDAAQSASDAVESAKDAASNAVENAKDAAANTAESAKDAATSAVNDAKDAAASAVDQAKSNAASAIQSGADALKDKLK